MNGEELSLLIMRISQSAGVDRAKVKREYLGIIKRLIRAEFTDEQIFVMVRALVENHAAFNRWNKKHSKPGTMQAIKRMLRRLGRI